MAERDEAAEGVRLRVRLQGVKLGRVPVLHEVALDCARGSHTAILGPNGAGKTTLLRAIIGLVPAHGLVEVDGQRLCGLPPMERARRITYVPQRSELQARLSVYEVVSQGRYAHQPNWLGQDRNDQHLSSRQCREHRAVEAALTMTDTLHLRQRPYPELSGGEQRRVLLARALASEAPVIALDEPTAALDIAHSLSLFAQLELLCRAGRTIVTVLHSLHEAAQFCDQAVVLNHGTLVYQGNPVLPAQVVKEVYGVEVVPGGAPSYRLVTFDHAAEGPEGA